jgi:hypothetical protein
VVFSFDSSDPGKSAKAIGQSVAGFSDRLTTEPEGPVVVDEGYLRFIWNWEGILEYEPAGFDTVVKQARFAFAELFAFYRPVGGVPSPRETLASESLLDWAGGPVSSIGAQLDFFDFWQDDHLKAVLLGEAPDGIPTLYSVEGPITYFIPWQRGVPVDINVFLHTGVNARWDGDSGVGFFIRNRANFSRTARIVSLAVLDKNFNRIAGPEAVHSANGYTYPVPEPTCIWQFISGLVLAWSMLGRGLLNIEKGDRW